MCLWTIHYNLNYNDTKELMKLAKLYMVSYGKCGMTFLIIKLLEGKSYPVSPHVASTFSNQLRIRHVAPNLSDRVSRALQGPRSWYYVLTTLLLRAFGLCKYFAEVYLFQSNELHRQILKTVAKAMFTSENSNTFEIEYSLHNLLNMLVAIFRGTCIRHKWSYIVDFWINL